MGRPAPLPARRRTRSPAARRAGARGRARRGHRDARRARSAIPNGTFGNRPHCIYRGFCLQGCKVNAKASPLVTHLPDAIEHGVEVRADCHGVARRDRRRPARCTGVTYVHDGRERFQRAAAVAVCGYSIETPRLLLNSTSARFPDGLANGHDQVGRYVMVQGAPQVAGRFPEPLRQYKAPPPEISSEQFYETDPARGFARGFSIQTVGPLPIALGRARARRRPLGPRAARVHARLQPLDDARAAVRAAAARRATASRSPTRPTSTACRSRASTTRSATTTARTSPTARKVLERDLGGGRRAGHADDRPLRPPRRRLPHGRLARGQRRRRRPPRLGRPEPLRLRRQRDADAGRGQPGADDHGAGLAAGRAPRREARSAVIAPAAAAANAPAATTPRCVVSHSCGLRPCARSSKPPCAPGSPGGGPEQVVLAAGRVDRRRGLLGLLVRLAQVAVHQPGRRTSRPGSCRRSAARPRARAGGARPRRRSPARRPRAGRSAGPAAGGGAIACAPSRTAVC